MAAAAEEGLDLGEIESVGSWPISLKTGLEGSITAGTLAPQVFGKWAEDGSFAHYEIVWPNVIGGDPKDIIAVAHTTGILVWRGDYKIKEYGLNDEARWEEKGHDGKVVWIGDFDYGEDPTSIIGPLKKINDDLKGIYEKFMQERSTERIVVEEGEPGWSTWDPFGKQLEKRNIAKEKSRGETAHTGYYNDLDYRSTWILFEKWLLELANMLHFLSSRV
eukprot:750651_1